jgi:hypothetical protein
VTLASLLHPPPTTTYVRTYLWSSSVFVSVAGAAVAVGARTVYLSIQYLARTPYVKRWRKERKVAQGKILYDYNSIFPYVHSPGRCWDSRYRSICQNTDVSLDPEPVRHCPPILAIVRFYCTLKLAVSVSLPRSLRLPVHPVAAGQITKSKRHLPRRTRLRRPWIRNVSGRKRKPEQPPNSPYRNTD